jgi:hypothetical protein
MKAKVINVGSLVDYVIAAVFVLVLAIPSLAQGGSPGAPPGAGPPPDINPKREERIRQASEARLRSAEMEAGEAAENQRHVEAAIANMKQDFTRIQVLRNNIARDLVAHKPLDYSLITEQTGEINKRAHRLNVYMLARTPESREQISAELRSEEMIGALVKLCKLIDSFTENPALKNVAIVAVQEPEKTKQEKARADEDLLAIIKLSESINKTSNSLRGPK